MLVVLGSEVATIYLGKLQWHSGKLVFSQWAIAVVSTTRQKARGESKERTCDLELVYLQIAKCFVLMQLMATILSTEFQIVVLVAQHCSVQLIRLSQVQPNLSLLLLKEHLKRFQNCMLLTLKVNDC